MEHSATSVINQSRHIDPTTNIKHLLLRSNSCRHSIFNPNSGLFLNSQTAPNLLHRTVLQYLLQL